MRSVADTGFYKGGFYYKIAREIFKSHTHLIKTTPISARFGEDSRVNDQSPDAFKIRTLTEGKLKVLSTSNLRQ